MPGCQGRPEGPCPNRRNDNSVKWSVCDLFLCPECLNYRHPLPSANTATSSVTKAPVSDTRTTSDITTDDSALSGNPSAQNFAASSNSAPEGAKPKITPATDTTSVSSIRTRSATKTTTGITASTTNQVTKSLTPGCATPSYSSAVSSNRGSAGKKMPEL